MKRAYNFAKKHVKEGIIDAAFGAGVLVGSNFADATIIPKSKKFYKKTKNYFKKK